VTWSADTLANRGGALQAPGRQPSAWRQVPPGAAVPLQARSGRSVTPQHSRHVRCTKLGESHSPLQKFRPAALVQVHRDQQRLRRRRLAQAEAGAVWPQRPMLRSRRAASRALLARLALRRAARSQAGQRRELNMRCFFSQAVRMRWHAELRARPPLTTACLEACAAVAGHLQGVWLQYQRMSSAGLHNVCMVCAFVR